MKKSLKFKFFSTKHKGCSYDASGELNSAFQAWQEEMGDKVEVVSHSFAISAYQSGAFGGGVGTFLLFLFFTERYNTHLLMPHGIPCGISFSILEL